jgi:hypothetical protein
MLERRGMTDPERQPDDPAPYAMQESFGFGFSFGRKPPVGNSFYASAAAKERLSST